MDSRPVELNDYMIYSNSIRTLGFVHTCAQLYNKHCSSSFCAHRRTHHNFLETNNCEEKRTSGWPFKTSTPTSETSCTDVGTQLWNLRHLTRVTSQPVGHLSLTRQKPIIYSARFQFLGAIKVLLAKRSRRRQQLDIIKSVFSSLPAAGASRKGRRSFRCTAGVARLPKRTRDDLSAADDSKRTNTRRKKGEEEERHQGEEASEQPNG